MATLRLVVAIVWALFWIGWLISAFTAKTSTSRPALRAFRALTLVAVIVLVRIGHIRAVAVHSVALGVVGVVLFGCGLAVAVWARLNLGRNWGMPMTEKAEPELVTSGPYRVVRHPIYSGLLLALVGSSLVFSLVGLLLAAIWLAYFGWASTVEERNLSASMPEAYPAYREHTKRLIPFVF